MISNKNCWGNLFLGRIKRQKDLVIYFANADWVEQVKGGDKDLSVSKIDLTKQQEYSQKLREGLMKDVERKLKKENPDLAADELQAEVEKSWQEQIGKIQNNPFEKKITEKTPLSVILRNWINQNTKGEKGMRRKGLTYLAVANLAIQGMNVDYVRKGDVVTIEDNKLTIKDKKGDVWQSIENKELFPTAEPGERETEEPAPQPAATEGEKPKPPKKPESGERPPEPKKEVPQEGIGDLEYNYEKDKFEEFTKIFLRAFDRYHYDFPGLFSGEQQSRLDFINNLNYACWAAGVKLPDDPKNLEGAFLKEGNRFMASNISQKDMEIGIGSWVNAVQEKIKARNLEEYTYRQRYTWLQSAGEAKEDKNGEAIQQVLDRGQYKFPGNEAKNIFIKNAKHICSVFNVSPPVSAQEWGGPFATLEGKINYAGKTLNITTTENKQEIISGDPNSPISLEEKKILELVLDWAQKKNSVLEQEITKSRTPAPEAPPSLPSQAPEARPEPAKIAPTEIGKEAEVIDITDQNFKKEVLQSKKLVIVDVWAEWCEPCKKQAPLLEEVVKSLEGKVKICRYNTRDLPRKGKSILNNYVKGGISDSVPRYLFFQNGNLLTQYTGLPQATEEDYEKTKEKESFSEYTKRKFKAAIQPHLSLVNEKKEPSPLPTPGPRKSAEVKTEGTLNDLLAENSTFRKGVLEENIKFLLKKEEWQRKGLRLASINIQAINSGFLIAFISENGTKITAPFPWEAGKDYSKVNLQELNSRANEILQSLKPKADTPKPAPVPTPGPAKSPEAVDPMKAIRTLTGSADFEQGLTNNKEKLGYFSKVATIELVYIAQIKETEIHFKDATGKEVTSFKVDGNYSTINPNLLLGALQKGKK